ncbi:carbohydrate ABC transporter permease [Paenibacillus sp. 7124]|uniref:Carbohydrate ABC transporter permease n=1 Tax=Paenibacillus apii TaxID=1850370 RepID=A0A6M1PJ58_9BACL|nr:carbohydrate ABC transporter permease [Paenibacillus apii]NGM83469.1 carbohydrate ABC transporter permease [Paenibacillus apii]
MIEVSVKQQYFTSTFVRKHRLRHLLFFIVACGFLCLSLFPYLYLLFSSFKTPSEVISSNPAFFPSRYTLDNYLAMFRQLSIATYFGNSFITAAFGTLLSVFLGAMASYGLTRFSSKIGNLFLVFTLGVRMIPLISVAIPLYRIIGEIGLMDTKLALILIYTSINIPFVIWMMLGFFDSLPKELDESARVDGCGMLGAFIRIILPISLPGLATTGIFSFMLSWNDFLFGLLFTSTSAKTVPVGISEFLTAYNLDLGPMTAAATLFSLPVMLLSFFMQNYIVREMTMGAVKE